METPRPLTIGDIAEQLLSDSLIDACELQKDRVVVIQDSNRHSFPYDQARAFMMGMMRGRPWTGEPLSGGDGAAPDANPSGGLHQAAARSLSKAVDELAATAIEMGLVKNVERRGDGVVNIALSSCEVELYAEEAVAYLADCVLTKLQTILGEARLAPATRSEAWTPDRQSQPALPGN